MNCDQVSTRLVDAITGNLDEEAQQALRRHIDGCVTCEREERELRTLWTELGRLPMPAPRADAPARFAAALSRAMADGGSPMALVPGSEPAHHQRRGWGRRLAIPASLAAALVIGLAVGREVTPSNDSTATSAMTEGRSQFLLLLHEPEGVQSPPPAELPRIVAEYTAWARDLERKGLLVAAEKLADDPGRWITSSAGGIEVRSGRTSSRRTIGGYFVITAESYEEAASIARECPHLRYGGEIEVRAIERV